ncbi:UNVERIFIED_CONTAM: hypothetical protein NCL1_27649 [Trichonephila clavipes]
MSRILKKWASVIPIDQAIEEPAEIMHINQDSENHQTTAKLQKREQNIIVLLENNVPVLFFLKLSNKVLESSFKTN